MKWNLRQFLERDIERKHQVVVKKEASSSEDSIFGGSKKKYFIDQPGCGDGHTGTITGIRRRIR